MPKILANQPNWTHVKEISNTGYLVSLSQNPHLSAAMRIFDVSKKDSVRTVYSFEKIRGCKLGYLRF